MPSAGDIISGNRPLVSLIKFAGKLPIDLILNASNYLWSLSIKNLTHHPWTRFVYEKRFNDLQKVWQNPRDIEYIIEVFKKYNVRYIFSTSEWGFQLYGTNHGYYAKPYSPEQYAEIFDQYLFWRPFSKQVQRMFIK
jgi:hypothetical protein